MNLNPFKKSSPRKILRHALVPDEKFVNKTKDRFLAEFDAHYGATTPSRTSHGMANWAKALVTAGALAAVMVSISAFADGTNVSADNPLYPLKRLSENIHLALAPAPERAQIEVTIAARRANEIQDLTSRKPSSTLIAGLSADFKNAVSSSLGHAESESSPTPNFRVGVSNSGTVQRAGSAAVAPEVASSSTICNQVSSIFSGSAAARLQVVNDPNLLKRFEDRCDHGDPGLDLVGKSGIVTQ